MGRDFPTVVMRPNHTRRDERARRARDTKNRVVPEMLRANARARHGIQKGSLIVDPPPFLETPQNGPAASARIDLSICVHAADTLTAARRMAERAHPASRIALNSDSRTQGKVALLNMASALRPGGGFLEGANSQEEFLCARTTLWPSLLDQYYRLPDVSAIYTPDVYVFRDNLGDDLPRRERYYVDCISASMFRAGDSGCSCGVSFCDRHRELCLRKMRAVMRVAQRTGAQTLVLGAWGCGAYGNPVREVARCWRKVIAGAPRQRRPNAEQWDGIKDIVFAIPDRSMLREFELAFRDILAPDLPPPANEENSGLADSGISMDDKSAHISELITKIAELEMHIEQSANSRRRAMLRETLAGLQRDLTHGLAPRDAVDVDMLPEDEGTAVDGANDEPDYVAGVPASDGEENSFYHIEERDVPSASDDDDDDRGAGAVSIEYEFRPHRSRQPRISHSPSSRSSSAADEEDEDDDSGLMLRPPLSRSPRFDPVTGWYAGSVDDMLRDVLSGGGNGGGGSEISPRGTPPAVLLRRESVAGEVGAGGGMEGFDEEKLAGYLRMYGGTDE